MKMKIKKILAVSVFLSLVFFIALVSNVNAVDFPNPIEADSLQGLLVGFLNALRGVVVTVAIIFIVIGGILYMTSAGDEKRITQAKNCWTGAVIGLAIVLAAPAFLREVISIVGGTNGVDTSQIKGPTLLEIAQNVLNFLLSIVGIIAIISLVIGGGMYLTSAGDEGRAETGKKITQYAIVGIIIALGSLVIVKQIATLIGAR